MSRSEPDVPAPDYPFGDWEGQSMDPRFAELRATQPLSRVQLPYGGEAWLATRHAEVTTVFADPRFSRAAAMGPNVPRQTPDPPEVRTIMDVDRPEHGRLRRIVAKAFTEWRVDRLRPFTRNHAWQLAEEMRDGGPPADLVTDVALPLPITVICHLLGVPLADQAEFRRWVETVVAIRTLSADEYRDVVSELDAYLHRLVRQRRENPTDDVLGVLVAARDGTNQLTEQELVSFGATLLVAGFETTARHIANSMHLLLTHPELRSAATDPDRRHDLVEELIRFVPLNAGTGLPRVATEDVELGGVTVRAGEAVFVSTISANRDERMFADPDTLDPTRDPNPHVTFGYGPHKCLGARLATMEIQESATALLTVLPTLTLSPEPDAVDWTVGGSVVRGPRRLMVTW